MDYDKMQIDFTLQFSIFQRNFGNSILAACAFFFFFGIEFCRSNAGGDIMMNSSTFHCLIPLFSPPPHSLRHSYTGINEKTKQ